MKYLEFGPLETKVAVIGQGTWNMESLSTMDFSKVIHRGLDLGMNHIDTAEMYGEGRVEILLGKALHQRREDIFLVSKVLPSNASRKKTIQACERSLRRLKRDYLDCYLLHWPGPHPLEETFSAFEELREKGKIHLPKLPFPPVNRLLRNPMLASGRVSRLRFRIPQNPDNLFFREALLLHAGSPQVEENLTYQNGTIFGEHSTHSLF